MKQTINFYDFERAFQQLRPDNFSYEGLKCLFEYFEELEYDTGEEIELDVIAICCDWTEDTAETICNDYNLSDIDELQDHTAVFRTESDTYVYLAY